MAIRRTIVKWFDAKKGYGFLVHPDGGADIFVHYSSVVSDKRFKTLRTGEEVIFDMRDGPKGVHAKNVEPTDPTGAGSGDLPEALHPSQLAA